MATGSTTARPSFSAATVITTMITIAAALTAVFSGSCGGAVAASSAVPMDRMPVGGVRAVGVAFIVLHDVPIRALPVARKLLLYLLSTYPKRI